MRRYWHYRWITLKGDRYYRVGLNADGSLYNPRAYPNEDELRAELERIVADDKAREHERRSAGAKKAAVTRARRQEKQVWQAANQIVQNKQTGPRTSCVCCWKSLTDPESIARGIGSECWQHVLTAIERIKASKMSAGAEVREPAA
jgi:Family of unknown function (DUF6011)